MERTCHSCVGKKVERALDFLCYAMIGSAAAFAVLTHPGLVGVVVIAIAIATLFCPGRGKLPDIDHNKQPDLTPSERQQPTL